MDFDTYARRLWTGRADAYEHGFARLTVHAVGALLDAAGVGTGTRVLDVGTGPGVVAGAATARGARVTAVDAEPSMAEAAARNVPRLDVRVAVLPARASTASRSRSACPVWRPYSSIRSQTSRRRLAWRPSGPETCTSWPRAGGGDSAGPAAASPFKLGALPQADQEAR